MKRLHSITSVSTTLAFCLVLGSTFIPYQILDNSFQLFPIACFTGIALIIACGLSIAKKGGTIPFQLPDMLLLAATGYYLFKYDYNECLADWKIYYAVMLLLFWWITRIMLSNHLLSERILMFGIALMGCVQAVWGLLQLYQLVPSYHNLYAITGSFYNPGPYTGYIAIFFPVCLYQALNTRKIEFYIWILMSGMLICTIPAGMSRSAWLALSVGTLFVVAKRFDWFAKARNLYHAKRSMFYACSCMLLLAMVSAGGLLLAMKPWSAYGRIFIWKNTLSAIAQNPLFGYGPGSFPYIYGKEQSAYFSQGNYSDWEKYVAGAPDYAFNEYLQTLTEGGILLFVLVAGFILLTVYTGFKRKKYAVCAGLLTFYVFALSSYPMQVLPFGVIVILFSSLCISEHRQYPFSLKRCCASGTVYVALFAIAAHCIYRLDRIEKAEYRILRANQLYAASMYAEAFSIYETNYEFFHHNPRLLLQYANRLMKQGWHDRAIDVLERCEKVSSDVAILHTKATCYQEMGKYQLAENCYLQSINRMPIRLYPYYKLAKLYANPAYSNPERMKEMIEFVLTNSPKVESKAAMQMKEEVQKMLDEIH